MSPEEINKLTKTVVKKKVIVAIPTGINMLTLKGEFVEIPFGTPCQNVRILKSGTVVADIKGQTLMSMESSFFAIENRKLADEISDLDKQIDKLLTQRNKKLNQLKPL